MESLYEKIRRIVTTEWNKIATVVFGGVPYTYRDEIEEYLYKQYDIPANKSSPQISKLEQEGVITCIRRKKDGMVYVLGQTSTTQGNLRPIRNEFVHTFETEVEATISLSSNAMRIGGLDTQLMWKLKELCPEFDSTMKPNWSSRKRRANIKISKNEIIIKVERKENAQEGI